MSEVLEETKVCTGCGKEKAIKEFYFYSSDCILCRSNKAKQWKKDNPKKWKGQRIRRDLKRKFNITLEQYNSLFLSQNCKCAICGIHQKNLDRRLAVDHDHYTGKIRGLLCNQCNRQLGWYEMYINETNDYLKGIIIE